MAQKLGYKQSADHIQKRIAARLHTLKAKPKPISETDLRRMYWEDGMTCVDIGRKAGKDPKTILTWMRHYGIPSRPRGHNADQLPKGREPGFRLTEAQKEAIRQARIKDGNVPYKRNGQHWLHTVDRDQHPNWKGGVTPDRQEFYCTDKWKEAVKAVWHRANAKCERCGKHHNTEQNRGNFHVHHIVSFAVEGLRAEVSNLALLCKPCHLFVHSRKNINNEFLGEQK